MRLFVSCLPLLLCLGLALFAVADAQAQVIETCCESGARPNKRCQADSECPDLCDGGFRDGQQCSSDLQCALGACDGGPNAGAACLFDAECPQSTCGPIGTCSVEGTCTATCFTRKFLKSPTNPVSSWQGVVPVVDNDKVCP